MVVAHDEDDLVFNASAFSVVSSWTLGGKSIAALVDEEGGVDAASASVHRAPVALYRPSAKSSDSLTRPTLGGSSKQLTEHEKQMKNKLLRKSGKYRTQQQEDENAGAAEDAAALDKEEQELVRYKSGASSSSAPTSTTVELTVSDAPREVAPSTASSDSRSSVVGANKKRKVSAQDELLEKLREEAARKKAKNLKLKLKQQRKKEEKRLQQQSPTQA